jgi:hypothetical protein
MTEETKCSYCGKPNKKEYIELTCKVADMAESLPAIICWKCYDIIKNWEGVTIIEEPKEKSA